MLTLEAMEAAAKTLEAKDDPLHQHVNAMRQAGYEVSRYSRYSANRGHVAAGPRGRNRMDKGRDPNKPAFSQQGYYTDPHLNIRYQNPKTGKGAITSLWKGRSKSVWDPTKNDFKHDFKTRDDIQTMLFDVPQMYKSPETGRRFRTNAFTAEDPKMLQKKLKKITPQESIQEKFGAAAAAPAKGGKKPNPEYAAPELPKSLNPADVHGYYMAMADHHDKRSWMHKRLSGLKPLWSDDRTMHDDRHLFHKAMRDGFAQKALAVDLAAPQDGQGSGFAGMKESIQESSSPERIQVEATVHTFEQFVEKYGTSPIEALRMGKIDRFTIVAEAFSGIAPTGSLNTVNGNKTSSSKPLALKSPFPSQSQHQPNANVGKVPKMPDLKSAMKATEAVASGANPLAVIESLMSGKPLAEELGHDPHNVFMVHLDRNVVAPGSKYHNWYRDHKHKVQSVLDRAGLGHMENALTSVGYDDVSLQVPSLHVAMDAARKLDAVLPPASDFWRNEYMDGKGHHAQVTEYGTTDDGDGDRYADSPVKTHYPHE